ncbi:hypothetical protein ASD24_17395 [Paenibacillus sp. Root52]|uniref:WIAG-tail domain n=1 Tax=Paenibacillus sp. Root52 TaxID=1736552 RepID=UPI0006FFF4F4|nr:WIAG-tail domain [Paenibacillus sp. Root52]KQY80708.1 hypothetical protein ASD24_17395 [Paenibacillus sp. Root52]
MNTAHLSEDIWTAIRQVSGETLEQFEASKRQEAPAIVEEDHLNQPNSINQPDHSEHLDLVNQLNVLNESDQQTQFTLVDQQQQLTRLEEQTVAHAEAIQLLQTSVQEWKEQPVTESKTDLSTGEWIQTEGELSGVTETDSGNHTFQLNEQSVQQAHLCDNIVGSEQLQAGAVQPQHLSFQPVRSVSRQLVVQQFGMEAFILPENEECVEVTVAFEESFASEHYVIVAMSNDRGFQVSLLSQSEDEAVLEVSRAVGCKHTYGLLSWIAAGPSV